MSSAWHDILHGRLRSSPYPIFDFEYRIIPAASVWTGSREWVNAFRGAGLVAGDRIAVALPASPRFLAVMVAALWEGLSIAPVDPRTPAGVALENADARLVVTEDGGSGCAHSWVPEGATSPPGAPPPLREARNPADARVRFLLRTSGTTGNARTVALSDENVLSVIRSHLPELGLAANEGDAGGGSIVMSVLPWHHSFGLVLDLLASVMAGAIIHRDVHSGRDPGHLARRIVETGATHLNTVPRTVSLLLSTEGGLEALRSLRGGTVGGAPVSKQLAEVLATTRLRVGYGQTEASPGICLGAPGEWSAGHLGRAVGCQTRIGARGTLEFRGVNACLGTFSSASGLALEAEGRWVDTRDYVEPGREGLRFLGRADDAFKLANGRLVDAGMLEHRLRAELAGVEEAAVFTDDGEHLYVALMAEAGTDLPARAEVARVLGPMASYLAGVFPLGDGLRFRTAKGALDRRQLTQLLRPAA